MFEKLRRNWQELKNGEPGKRFQDRYERRRKARRSGASRFLFLFAGIVLFAAGIFFLPAPGPGTVILVLGAGLIAQEWSAAARVMDWLELRIRALMGWGGRLWGRSPTPVRALLVLVLAAAGGGIAYGAYRIAFG